MTAKAANQLIGDHGL